MIVERYRLTLTHTLVLDNEIINVEEPKVFEIHNTDLYKDSVGSYKEYLLDQLFTRFRRELKEQNNVR